MSGHPELKWHEVTEEWYCMRCGRTSNQAHLADAWVELQGFDCEPPTPRTGDLPTDY
jgi:hypothetical protein